MQLHPSILDRRYLMTPSQLLAEGTEAVEELLATLSEKAGNDSFVSIVAALIDDTPFLKRQKNAVWDNQTAIVEYVAEYSTNSAEVADALEERMGAEDLLGAKILSKLKTIWRLKALGLAEILVGLEEEMTSQIQQYVTMVISYASENTVSDNYCAQSAEVVAEACLTFSTSNVLLELREEVASQIATAAREGVNARIRKAALKFLQTKSKEDFDKLRELLPSIVDASTYDDNQRLKTIAHVLVEDALKQWPEAPTFGEEAYDVIQEICKVLGYNVSVGLVLKIAGVSNFLFMHLSKRTHLRIAIPP